MDFILGSIVGLILVFIILVALEKLGYSHPINMSVVAEIESSNNPKAYNEKSQARGLFQITPIALRHYNETSNYHLLGLVEDDELFDPNINRKVASWYLNWLYDRTWTVRDTLIAYNWGIGNWRKWRIRKDTLYSANTKGLEFYTTLPKETQDYLKKYEELTGTKL